MDSPKKEARSQTRQFLSVCDSEIFPINSHLTENTLYITSQHSGRNINVLQFETIEDLVENAHGRRATDKTIALLTFHRETSADLTRETDYYEFVKTKNL